jgi:hypothetical protein
MRVPAWLDRSWTYLVYTAFVFMALIWSALWYERHPALGVIWVGLLLWSLGSQALTEFRRQTRDGAIDRPRDPRRTP